eukprot:CAMPEP_0185291686 /NCGR_PEP_ID=MMETSP1363-20130426/5513_1 /TAXON_ID=38817 /ORGANISM="Gephyrocapsa oceanica, Strain RCC1303" /LENGTH=77 /DNA_ID=CAMNT_0027887831 /DNA_START=79 /DNA_END=312 /DNA_ORIENTATION=-
MYARGVAGESRSSRSLEPQTRLLSADLTAKVCMFRSTPGSAQSSYFVRSGPIPAKESATATLTLAGNRWAASLTLLW